MTYSPELLDISPFEPAPNGNAEDKNTGFRIVTDMSEPNGDGTETQIFRACLGNVSGMFGVTAYTIDGTKFYQTDFPSASRMKKRFAQYLQNWSEFSIIQYLAKGMVATKLFKPMHRLKAGYYLRCVCVVISSDEIDKCPDEVRRTYPRSPKGELIVSAAATKPPVD